jgi:hypothetical protein
MTMGRWIEAFQADELVDRILTPQSKASTRIDFRTVSSVQDTRPDQEEG